MLAVLTLGSQKYAILINFDLTHSFNSDLTRGKLVRKLCEGEMLDLSRRRSASSPPTSSTYVNRNPPIRA